MLLLWNTNAEELLRKAVNFVDTHPEEFVLQVIEQAKKDGLTAIIEERMKKVKEEFNATREAGSSNNISTTTGGSQTAKGVALMRAIAYECGFGPDRLAKTFISDWGTNQLPLWGMKFKRTGKLPTFAITDTRDASQLVTFLQNRTCFIDDALMQFLEQHAKNEQKAPLFSLLSLLPLPPSRSHHPLLSPPSFPTSLSLSSPPFPFPLPFLLSPPPSLSSLSPFFSPLHFPFPPLPLVYFRLFSPLFLPLSLS